MSGSSGTRDASVLFVADRSTQKKKNTEITKRTTIIHSRDFKDTRIKVFRPSSFVLLFRTQSRTIQRTIDVGCANTEYRFKETGLFHQELTKSKS